MATRTPKKAQVAKAPPEPVKFDLDWSKLPKEVQDAFVVEVFRLVRAKLPDIDRINERLARIENSVTIMPESRPDPDTASDFKKGPKLKEE